MGHPTRLRDPFLRVVLPWRGALARCSAEGAPNWRDINQVRHIWQDIAQVLPHMRLILPFPSHLRHIVPDWREGGEIFRKCATPWQNIAQVRRAGAVTAGQQAEEGAGLEIPCRGDAGGTGGRRDERLNPPLRVSHLRLSKTTSACLSDGLANGVIIDVQTCRSHGN